MLHSCSHYRPSHWGSFQRNVTPRVFSVAFWIILSGTPDLGASGYGEPMHPPAVVFGPLRKSPYVMPSGLYG